MTIPHTHDIRKDQLRRDRRISARNHVHRRCMEIAERDEKPSDTDIELWRNRHER